MPLYIFSLRSRRLSHEIENDPFVEIYSGHELLSYCDEEEICSFIFMKLLKKHSIAAMKAVPTVIYLVGTNICSNFLYRILPTFLKSKLKFLTDFKKGGILNTFTCFFFYLTLLSALIMNSNELLNLKKCKT